MKNLHDIIKKETKKVELVNNESIESIANLVLLSISADPIFQDTYSLFGLSRCNDPEIENKTHFVINTPKLNQVSGVTNYQLSRNYIDVFETFNNDYDTEPFDDNNEEYFFERNLAIIKSFNKLLINNENFHSFCKALGDEQQNDPEFLHRLSILTRKDKSISLILNVSFQLSEWSQDLKGLSINTKIKNSLHDSYYNFHLKKVSDNTILDDFNDYCFYNLAKLSRFDILKNIAKNTFTNLELKKLLTDDHLGKVPVDIINMIDGNNTQKQIFKQFKAKYSSKILNIIFSSDSFEYRKIQYCESYFNETKNKCLTELTKKLHSNTIESLFLTHHNVIALIKNATLSHFPQFDKKNINFEFIESPSANLGTSKVYNYLNDNNNLSIFKYYEEDVIFKGMHFLNKENIDNYSEKPKTYILLKDSDHVIGGVTLRHDSCNVCSILSVCISDPYKQQGLLKTLYQELANYGIANKKIISSSIYTKEGALYIPKTKNDIINNNPNLLFLRTEYQGGSDYQEITKLLNVKLLDFINTLKSAINIPQLKKVYDSSLKLIQAHCLENKNIEHTHYSKSIFEEIKKSIILKINNKNKL